MENIKIGSVYYPALQAKTGVEILQNLEHSFDAQTVLAGFIGSRMIGLHNDTSDYDIRAVLDAAPNQMPSKQSFAYPYRSQKIEITVFPLYLVEANILKWDALDKTYPTILSGLDHVLVHEDETRSQFRLASPHCFLYNKKILAEHRLTFEKGTKNIDYIDYEYSRAYMNLSRSLSKESVAVRKYLYTFYEILCIDWWLRFSTFPPGFQRLMIEFPFPEKVGVSVYRLFEMNRTGQRKETLFTSQDSELNSYIKICLKRQKDEIRAYAAEKKNQVCPLL